MGRKAARLGEITGEPGKDLSSAGGAWRQRKKKTVLAIVQRGGRVRADVVPSRKATTLRPHVVKYVLPDSTVFTDEWPSYNGLDRRYTPQRIRHSEKVYVAGDLHIQTIEAFFSNLKRGIAGTYHAVSSKWLPGYLNEYPWRFDHRHDPGAMFRLLLLRAVRS